MRIPVLGGFRYGVHFQILLFLTLFFSLSAASGCIPDNPSYWMDGFQYGTLRVDIINGSSGIVEDFKINENTYDYLEDFTDQKFWGGQYGNQLATMEPEKYRLFMRSWIIPNAGDYSTNYLLVRSQYDPDFTNYPFRYWINTTMPLLWASASYLDESTLPAELEFNSYILDMNNRPGFLGIPWNENLPPHYTFVNNCGYTNDGIDLKAMIWDMLIRTPPIQNTFSGQYFCGVSARSDARFGFNINTNTNMFLLNLLHPSILSNKGLHRFTTIATGTSPSHSPIEVQFTMNRDHNKFLCMASDTRVMRNQISVPSGQENNLPVIRVVWDEDANIFLGGKCCGPDRLANSSQLPSSFIQTTQTLLQNLDNLPLPPDTQIPTLQVGQDAQNFMEFVTELQSNIAYDEIVDNINAMWDNPDQGRLACLECLSGENQPLPDDDYTIPENRKRRAWSTITATHTFKNPFYAICNKPSYIAAFGDSNDPSGKWKFLCRPDRQNIPQFITTSNHCCGDDAYDCGATSDDNTTVCRSIDANPKSRWQWAGRDPETDTEDDPLIGKIYKLNCMNLGTAESGHISANVLATGDRNPSDDVVDARIITCLPGNEFTLSDLGVPQNQSSPNYYERGPTVTRPYLVKTIFGSSAITPEQSDKVSNPFTLTIGTPHDYICYRKPQILNSDGTVQSHEQMMIAECAGSASPYSDTGANAAGERYTTGYSVQQIAGPANPLGHWYYCTSDKKFTRNLDLTNKDDCQAARNPDGTPSYLGWTGRRCCGEHDDTPGGSDPQSYENYFDPAPDDITGNPPPGGTGTGGGYTPGGGYLSGGYYPGGVTLPTGGGYTPGTTINPNPTPTPLPGSFDPSVLPAACYQSYYQATGAYLTIDELRAGRLLNLYGIIPGQFTRPTNAPPPAYPYRFKEAITINGEIHGCAIDTENLIDDEVNMEDNPEFTRTYHDPRKPYEGTFYYPGTDDNPDDTVPAPNRLRNDALLDILQNPDRQTPSPSEGGNLSYAIIDHTYCAIVHDTIVTNKKYYCAYNEIWQEFTGNAPTHLSYVPQDVEQDKIAEGDSRANCCLPNQCWNDHACVDSFLYNLNVASEWKTPGDGYRCYNGAWLPATKRYTPNRERSGYCAQPTQCLWNPQGQENNPANPICVPAGTLVDDYHCRLSDDGQSAEWTSRTHHLAGAMLKLVDSANAENDYTLICDRYNDITNHYQYSIDGYPIDLSVGDSAKTYADTTCIREFVYPTIPQGYTSRIVPTTGTDANAQYVPCANAFCVLKYSNHAPIIGTTFNRGLDAMQPKMLNLFNMDSACRSQIMVNSTDFSSCLSQRGWLSGGQRMVLYSTQGFNLQAAIAPTWWQKLSQKIIEFFQRIYQLITNSSTDFDQVISTLLDDHTIFEQIYLESRDAKIVQAVAQSYYPIPSIDVGMQSTGERTHYLFIDYKGFTNQNVCTSISRKFNPLTENYQCLDMSQTGGHYRLFHEIADPTQHDPNSGLFPAWAELTQKLRVD